MSKFSFNRFNSLRNRMLLLFLLILTSDPVCHRLYRPIRDLQTLQLGRCLSLAHASASMVRDKLQNRANLLESALADIAKNFSVKELIASGKEDPASLVIRHEKLPAPPEHRHVPGIGRSNRTVLADFG